jgi:poly(hydroxyalkanoate) depolymerase family esterase
MQPLDDEDNLGRSSAALVAIKDFGTNPAALEMHKYVPADMPSTPRPLVVVLHGCTQTAAAYESAGWSALADQWKFYVVYPQQNTQRNNSSGCFNWGGRWKSAPSAFVLSPEPLELDEIKRGHGENQSIKEMVDKMKADHKIDDARVFVTGLSAGGAMASLLLATWPDVFSAGAIFAGVPYGCATNKKTTAEAGNCLKDYTGANAYLARTPEQWGDLVRAAHPGHTGPYPRVSIWHGTADFVVNARNATELMKQWTNVHGIDQTPDADAAVESYPHKEYKDASGKTLVETYDITGKSHGTEVAPNAPLDPAQPNGPKCGKAGAYILSANICSTYYAGQFFGLDRAADGAGPGAAADGGGSSSSSGGGKSASGGGNSSGAAEAPGSSSAGGTCAVRPGSAGRSLLGVGALASAAALLLLARRRRAG